MFEVTNYLFVDPHGTEFISDTCPFRIDDDIYDSVPPRYIKSHPIREGYNTWATEKRNDDYGYYGYDYNLEATEIPKGTIKKLTGKELTYRDDPIIFDWNTL